MTEISSPTQKFHNSEKKASKLLIPGVKPKSKLSVLLSHCVRKQYLLIAKQDKILKNFVLCKTQKF